MEKSGFENPLLNEGELLEAGICAVASGACDMESIGEEDVEIKSFSTLESDCDDSDSDSSSFESGGAGRLPPLGPPMVFNDVLCVAGCGQVMGQLKHVPRTGTRKEKFLCRARRPDGAYDAMGNSNRSRHVSCHGGDAGACLVCKIQMEVVFM